MIRLVLHLGLVFLFAGCSLSTPVYLAHPQTGATAQCGPYSMAGPGRALAAPQHEAQCIQDWKEQGYVRVATPK